MASRADSAPRDIKRIENPPENELTKLTQSYEVFRKIANLRILCIKDENEKLIYSAWLKRLDNEKKDNRVLHLIKIMCISTAKTKPLYMFEKTPPKEFSEFNFDSPHTMELLESYQTETTNLNKDKKKEPETKSKRSAAVSPDMCSYSCSKCSRDLVQSYYVKSDFPIYTWANPESIEVPGNIDHNEWELYLNRFNLLRMKKSKDRSGEKLSCDDIMKLEQVSKEVTSSFSWHPYSVLFTTNRPKRTAAYFEVDKDIANQPVIQQQIDEAAFAIVHNKSFPGYKMLNPKYYYTALMPSPKYVFKMTAVKVIYNNISPCSFKSCTREWVRVDKREDPNACCKRRPKCLKNFRACMNNETTEKSVAERKLSCMRLTLVNPTDFQITEEEPDKGDDSAKRFEELTCCAKNCPNTCPKPDCKPKPECKSEPKLEPKPEPKPECKPEPKQECKSEPKPKCKPEPKPECKPEPKPECQPEPKPVTTSCCEPKPKVECKSERKSSAAAVNSCEPKPKPAAKFEPKAEYEPKPVAATGKTGACKPYPPCCLPQRRKSTCDAKPAACDAKPKTESDASAGRPNQSRQSVAADCGKKTPQPNNREPAESRTRGANNKTCEPNPVESCPNRSENAKSNEDESNRSVNGWKTWPNDTSSHYDWSKFSDELSPHSEFSPSHNSTFAAECGSGSRTGSNRSERSRAKCGGGGGQNRSEQQFSKCSGKANMCVGSSRHADATDDRSRGPVHGKPNRTTDSALDGDTSFDDPRAYDHDYDTGSDWSDALNFQRSPYDDVADNFRRDPQVSYSNRPSRPPAAVHLSRRRVNDSGNNERSVSLIPVRTHARRHSEPRPVVGRDDCDEDAGRLEDVSEPHASYDASYYDDDDDDRSCASDEYDDLGDVSTPQVSYDASARSLSDDDDDDYPEDGGGGRAASRGDLFEYENNEYCEITSNNCSRRRR